MKLKFIGQGLDYENKITAGNFIIDAFESKNYSTFNAFIAFVSVGGLNNIVEQLVEFKENGGVIRLYLGVDLNATSKEALEKLLQLGIESYVIYSPNSIIYHPKVYAFEGNEVTRAIIGSSNLTQSGLFQNIEASVCIDFQNDEEIGNEFLADMYDQFNAIINQTHESCQPLTQEVLDILIDSKVVLPEAVNWAKSNKINKEFGQKEAKSNTKLLQLFGKVTPKRPPKGFKKTVTKQALIKAEKTTDINVVYEKAELISGSMWIESRSMTGGSRNILDLSKKGKLDGLTKFGSVNYFGLDSNDTSIEKSIDIVFGDKIYRDNLILYTEGNENWRIQLNGKTEDGEKITIYSKPSLGQNGGFQNKILVFSKLDDMTFQLEILDKEELSKLIENSSDWAKSGNETTGRAYGIIQ